MMIKWLPSGHYDVVDLGLKEENRNEWRSKVGWSENGWELLVNDGKSRRFLLTEKDFESYRKLLYKLSEFWSFTIAIVETIWEEYFKSFRKLLSKLSKFLKLEYNSSFQKYFLNNALSIYSILK